MMMTEMVSKTLISFDHLMYLMAQEDLTEFGHHNSFISYTTSECCRITIFVLLMPGNSKVKLCKGLQRCDRATSTKPVHFNSGIIMRDTITHIPHKTTKAKKEKKQII
jgi:hypothetical protein